MQAATVWNTHLRRQAMSRGMPSMTALLGMLALAGYQNRDKLAEMFNDASPTPPNPRDSEQPQPQGDMLSSLRGMLGGAGVGGLLGGGLNELLERFTYDGQDETAPTEVCHD